MKNATKNLSFDFKIVGTKSATAPDECLIEGYANTSSKDRVGDVVMPEAFEKSLPVYLKNPILLENHDWTKVAGKVTSAELTDKGLYIKARISDTRPDLKTLIREGCLSTFSIGYNEVTADYDESTKTKYIKELELLEISVVSVPANTEASFTQVTAKVEAEGAEKQEVKITRGEGESTADCVSRGIETLINEGEDKDQAAAIAYSMCGEKSAAKPCCKKCDEEKKKMKTAKDLQDFILTVKSALNNSLNDTQLVAVCDYFNSNEEHMTKDELLKILKGKSEAGNIPAPAEAAKADQPKPAEEAPKADDAAAAGDAMKQLMAKIDAIGQACAQMLEKMDEMAKAEAAEDAEDQQEDQSEDAEKAKKPEAKPADAPKDDAKPADEMKPEDVEKHIADLDAQIAELEDTSNS